MKKVKFGATKEIKDFNKIMKEILFNGEMIASYKETGTTTVFWKVTNIPINGKEYFGLWDKWFSERDNKWFLICFGDAEKVEKELNEYTDSLIENGLVSGIEAA